MPPHRSLRKKDAQDFMKRLRFASDVPLRYYLCGEYGTHTLRPHYHICLFGSNFHEDRKHYKTTPEGFHYYNSETLNDRWGFGHVVIAELTFETAAYTARYVTKKISGAKAPEHYGQREPEFALMSRRPGLGTGWLEKNITDIERGICWQNGLTKTPKFYKKKIDQTKLLKLKYKQKKEALKKFKQTNPYTLDAVQKSKLNLKPKKEI